jgi:hypothetical protein
MKKEVIGTIKIAEIYKKIRSDFHRPIKAESNKKKVKREKNRLKKEIKEYYNKNKEFCA